jgi:molecular chaperone HscC
MIIGIDLGTTNSLVGAYLQGEPKLFPNALGSDLTPSAISIDETGSVIVGAAAIDRLVTHPNQSIAQFKRWMGSNRETLIDGRRLRPEELSALVLRSLVGDAEAATGEKVSEAVISVPAYFSDAQRKATRAAGELAGIKVERLINEPTAAALAYGLQERAKGGRFLIFDLGGGTLDVSLIEIFEGIVEVHASAGDNFLGGDDFLDVLIKAAAHDLDFDLDSISPTDRAQLRRRVEQLKVSLTHNAESSTDLSVDGRVQRWSMSERRFADLAAPLIQRLRMPLERTLRDANLAPDKLDAVVLVGGASRMPLVVRMVSRLMGRMPLRHVQPDRAIALGAAIASGLKARHATLEEVILTDVCPHTLGMETARQDSTGTFQSGFMLPIINRNSTVPVSREREVRPLHEKQKQILLKIYQGEHSTVANNIKLGELNVALPAGAEHQDRGVAVRFTYDVNGLLQVEARVNRTNQTYTLVLEQNPGLLSPAEITKRLAALAELKIHPRDKQENLAVIARAERLYTEYLAERERLQVGLVEFRRVLESQDEREIARAREEFSAMLNAIERR